MRCAGTERAAPQPHAHPAAQRGHDLTPEQRRQRTLSALVSQMEALARQNAVLMIFEDAHWTDPTSLELFGRIVDRIPSLPVLLIVTFRPEFDAPWLGRSYVTALMLNRLGQRDIGAMIDAVIGNNALSPSVRQGILERADGIPLFIEEMTKAVLEAGSEDAAQRTTAAIPSSTQAVPASLHRCAALTEAKVNSRHSLVCSGLLGLCHRHRYYR
jgi:predicted ATPase